jgi:hypothetical protein
MIGSNVQSFARLPFTRGANFWESQHLPKNQTSGVEIQPSLRHYSNNSRIPAPNPDIALA